ncbi:MAG: DUF4197 domain-containing protein [Desulfobacteraceae bacterium]
MKNFFIIVGAALLLFAWFPGQACAESSWWNKGADLLKNMSEESKEEISKEPTHSEIGKAFKQALRIGSENVVNKLGTVDGFNADASVHIPLPEKLNTVKTMLSKVGMSQLADDLELKLNRAAEAATPKAKSLFLEAITDMTFEDIKTIYEGPENSATKYFQGRMSPDLKQEMQPVVENTLSEVGAIKAYDKMIGQYQTLPFVPDIKADLTEHVLQKGMDGIFHYLAEEEASIRKDPGKQATELLKKVFGGK